MRLAACLRGISLPLLQLADWYRRVGLDVCGRAGQRESHATEDEPRVPQDVAPQCLRRRERRVALVQAAEEDLETDTSQEQEQEQEQADGPSGGRDQAPQGSECGIASA